MNLAMEGEGKLQHVLEIAGQHREPASMRQAVGEQRDQRAADDREQTKADPSEQQQPKSWPVRQSGIGLRVGQHIYDPAEQHRLSKLRYSQRHVGERKEPAQATVRSQLFQDAAVKA